LRHVPAPAVNVSRHLISCRIAWSRPEIPRAILTRTATYAVFRNVLPDMPEAEPKVETAQAIAYAANHGEWFWGRGRA
jgi:hypothetical protein